MHFAEPVYLGIAALLLPALSWFLWWSWRKKEEAINLFVRSRLLASLTVGVSRRRQVIKRVLIGLAAALLLLTLAQPQWGASEEQVRSRGLDIIVALDTSKSMLAQDLRPNRLERAKLAALDLLELAANDRLGLVAFAGNAFLQCPLTLDEEAFRSTLKQLDTETISEGGTALAEAIDTAARAFKEDSSSRALVLFTDGEDHEQGALEAARRAAQQHVRIFTIGVGTANGELLYTTDPYANKVFIKDSDGNVVKSRLDEMLLKSIAEVGDGFYLPLQNRQTIQTLYERGLAPLPKTEGVTRTVRQFHERFQIPLALAILLLIAEIFVPDHRRVEKSDEIVMATNTRLKQAMGTSTAMAVILALSTACSSVMGSPASARRQYERGRFKEAQTEYEKLMKADPGSPSLSFNAGAAAYRQKKFDEASTHFEKAVQTEDLGLQESAFYNLGNALFELGETAPNPQEKMKFWQGAAGSFSGALKLKPDDADAKYNLDLVKQRLEELKKQMPQQSQSKPQTQENQQSDPSKPPQSDQKQDNKDSQSSEQARSDPNTSDEKNGEPSKSKETASDSGEKKNSPPEEAENSSGKEGEKSDTGKPEPKPGDSVAKDGKPNGSAESGKGEPGAAGTDEGEAGAAAEGKMTPTMAERLLDAQKGNEKAMMFRLVESKDRAKSTRKDW